MRKNIEPTPAWHTCALPPHSSLTGSLSTLHTLHRRSSAVVRIDDRDNILIHAHNSLSVDVWFYLLEGGDDDDSDDEDGERCAKYCDGILFGTQSTAAETRFPWRHNHQLAFVNSDKALYYSVVDEKPEIASDLKFNRWYHLALTYGNQTVCAVHHWVSC